jgi:serine protease Do
MKKISLFSTTRLIIVLSLFALALNGCSGAGQAQLAPSGNAPSEPSIPPPTSQAPIVLGEGVRGSYADVVERVSPAVVNVLATRRVNANQQQQRSPLEDLLPDFNQQGPRGGQQPPVSRGVGSGVIVNSNGTILTNHHVVEGATAIEVELTDRRRFQAKVVGSDPPTDLAVLKVEQANLPFMNLGDSDKVRVGDVVLAVGNPLGIGQTVTLGIISAKGRRTGGGDATFEEFLQTDAPINRGNSGGALVNITGELIGINSQILSSGMSGGSIGIGFAIPSNMARGVADQLIKTGKVRRGLLGVTVQDASQLASTLDLKETRGAVVSSVQAGSAAEKAGLKRYDVITALNGEAITDGNYFRNRVASFQPGTEITLTIVRDGKEQQIKATLDERTTETAQNEGGQNPNNPQQPQNESSGKLGLGLQPLTPEIARRLQVQAERGLVVTEVDQAGPAAEAGIVEGDVILEVNRQQVGSFEDIQAALQRAGDRAVLMLIGRRGQTVFLTVQPRK